MRRALAIRPANQWNPAEALDTVVLSSDERHRRRAVLTGEGGTTVLLDLPHATMLRNGDGLLLEDGALVRVVGKPEPLVEVSAGSETELLRLAWHIGNRHTPVQVIGNRLRIRRDHVLEDMLRKLGAKLTPLEAPFEPEHGAYDHGAHVHHHHDA